MTNKNKCFFSISLENGIIITGKDSNEVINYLQDMHSAFFELWNTYLNNGLKTLAENTIQQQEIIKRAIDTIIETIESNSNH